MAGYNADSKPATATTIKYQQQVKDSLPFRDEQDFVNASRGLIARPESGIIGKPNGDIVWNNDAYEFLEGECPNEANPSLWRQSRLTVEAGLYQVVPRIYQVRGFDLSNTTIIEGKEGIIVIDPLCSTETAEAAYSLYQKTCGPRDVKAIIYTHSHVDHFGGVQGFFTQKKFDPKEVRVIAPDGFLEHAVSENVYAGTAMARRAVYMYGNGLKPQPDAHIGCGLGQAISSGTVTLIAPTKDDTVTTTGQEMIVDGVRIVFQMAPDSEAPSEMLMYFPEFNALCAAEDATHTFHNILTLRGAVVRDPHQWAKYLTETIDMFGRKADVVFASHHWPIWNDSGLDDMNDTEHATKTNRVVQFLTLQRDVYAYVHDQTLRLLNKGFNGPEIAEQMTLPPALTQAWNARGYYGTISHNVKAIYQRYMGWFDGNPAHLYEHIPVDKAKRYVKALGGIKEVVCKGQEAFDEGDYRWAAELLNHAVFAHPEYKDAKYLLADTYEQLGYGSESGPWRNFFLSGASELRHGKFNSSSSSSIDVLTQLTPDMVLDTLAIQINGPEAWNQKLTMDVVVTDLSQRYSAWLSNGALVYSTAAQPTIPEVTITATSSSLPYLLIFKSNVTALEKAGIKITGDVAALDNLFGLLDPGDPNFNIVTP